MAARSSPPIAVQGRCHSRGVSKVDDQLVTRDLGLRGGRQPCRPYPAEVSGDVRTPGDVP